MVASQLTLRNCTNLIFRSGMNKENDVKKVALLYSNPLLMYTTDIARAATACGNIDVGSM